MSFLFVISDLHLGGRPHSAIDSKSPPGSQINSSYSHLTDFIDWIASGQACKEDVELVINGDIVDFLLYDDYGDGLSTCPWTNNEKDATTKLEIIIARTREHGKRGPFDAMKDLLKAGHSLTFILGNHDVELSLPGVRHHLCTILEARKKSLNFIYDGEAYVRGSLLIEHGNRYDRFNITDHSGLRQERSAMSRGLPLHTSTRNTGRFQPPAGSILLTEILNRIKNRYRFLDLLKPETGAVFPLLLAMCPKLEHVLSGLLTLSVVSSRWVASGMLGPAEPRSDNQLGAENSESLLDLRELLRQELKDDTNLFPISRSSFPNQLGAAEKWENFKTLSGKVAGYFLDQSDFFSAWRTEDSRRKQLLASLRALRNDHSFDLHHESSEYLDAARVLARDGRFSTIIFGHTHLPKQLDIMESDLFKAEYINTGTWADVIRVPQEILFDSDINQQHKALEEFIEALQSNRLENHITRYLSYARVELDENNKVKSARLYSYVSREKPEAAPLTSAEATWV